MNRTIRKLMAMLALAGALAMERGAAQTTAFTYQGRLNSNGAGATGGYDLRFGLFTNAASGNGFGLVTNAGVTVSNGLFTTTIDFGNVFNGAAYWLEIGVRSNGSAGTFVTLAPRQAITSTPYAIAALNASNVLGSVAAAQLTGTLPATVLSGTFSNSVNLTNAGNSFAGSGAGLSGVPTPTQTNYLFAVDTATQYFPTTNFITLSLNSPLIANGWGINTNGTVTVQQSGLYQVSYNIHLENLYTQTVIHMSRVLLNGSSEITGSEGIASVTASYNLAMLSKTFLVNLATGQTLIFQAASGYGNNYSCAASGSYLGQAFYDLEVSIVRLQ